MIGDRDVIHSPVEQLFVQLLGIGIAVGEIESTEKPFFRPRAVAGVNM